MFSSPTSRYRPVHLSITTWTRGPLDKSATSPGSIASLSPPCWLGLPTAGSYARFSDSYADALDLLGVIRSRRLEGER